MKLQSIILSSYLLSSNLLASQGHRLRGLARHGQHQDMASRVLCKLIQLEIEYGDEEKEDEDIPRFLCETTADQEQDGQSGMLYEIDLPQWFLTENSPWFTNQNAEEMMISIPGAQIIRTNATTGHDVILYNHDTPIAILPQSNENEAVHNRRLDRRTGNHRVLVVMVSALDTQPILTAEVASERIFGLGANPQSTNLISQFDACSFGQLKLEPAIGQDITNGVGTILIESNVTGENILAVQNTMRTLTEAKYGRRGEQWDLVMFCAPVGPLLYGRNYLAFGYLGSYRSVYSDGACVNFSVFMHEIGHNLGLRHSGENGQNYADITGLMGYSSGQLGGPASCFNGAKNYYLGWYDNRMVELTDGIYESSWSGAITAFVDYDKTSPDDAVIIKIGEELFLQYNRAKDFNFETRERANEVTIVHQISLNHDSYLLGGVAADKAGAVSTLHINNFEGNGYDLVVEACSHIYGEMDQVELSIYIDNGLQHSTCGLAGMPSTLMSPSPSFAPTDETCEDTKQGKFQLKDGSEMSCVSLSLNPTLQEEYCVSTTPAFHVCEDTCGKCQDYCEDASSRKTFYVNKRWGRQTCRWLSVRPQWQELLCHSDHPAYDLCGETCNSCEHGEAAPPPPEACDDSKDEGAVYVSELSGYRSCSWLSNFPNVWQERLCSRTASGAAESCPETCGVCTDTCEDDKRGRFFVNSRRGKENCEWLSTRPFWQQFLCRPDHDAFTICKETCDSCIARRH